MIKQEKCATYYNNYAISTGRIQRKRISLEKYEIKIDSDVSKKVSQLLYVVFLLWGKMEKK